MELVASMPTSTGTGSLSQVQGKATASSVALPAGISHKRSVLHTFCTGGGASDMGATFVLTKLLDPALAEVEQAAGLLTGRRLALEKLSAHVANGSFPKSVTDACVPLQMTASAMPGLDAVMQAGQAALAKNAEAKRHADLAALHEATKAEVSYLESLLDKTLLKQRLVAHWDEMHKRVQSRLNGASLQLGPGVDAALEIVQSFVAHLHEKAAMAALDREMKAEAKAKAGSASTMEVDGAASDKTLLETVNKAVDAALRKQAKSHAAPRKTPGAPAAVRPPSLADGTCSSLFGDFFTEAQGEDGRPLAPARLLELGAQADVELGGRQGWRARQEEEDGRARQGQGVLLEGGVTVRRTRRGRRARRSLSLLSSSSQQVSGTLGVGRVEVGWIDAHHFLRSTSSATELRLPPGFDVRRAVTYPDEWLALSSTEQLAFVFLHSKLYWLDTRITNRAFQNPFALDVPAAVRTLLSLNLKFIPRPPVDKDMVLSGYGKLERAVRLRAFFGSKPDRDFNPRFHIASSSWQPPVEDRDRDVERGLQLGRNVLMRALHRVGNTSVPSNVSAESMRILRDFLAKGRVVIKPSDKNLGIAVLPLDWYVSECERQLADSSTYRLCDIDTPSLIEALHDLVGEGQDFFTAQERAFVLVKDADQVVLPEFYVIPKLHKTPIVGRPIVPSHSWVTSNLSIWLDTKLRPLLSLFPWILRDSKQLLQQLPKCLDSRYSDVWLMTADISSMYTNLDTVGAVKIVVYLWREFYGADKEDEARFIGACTAFVLQNNFLGFRGRAFQQIAGAAMGSPCIPVLANLYVGAHERHLFGELYGPDFVLDSVLFYRRFLDDVCTVQRGFEWEMDAFKASLNTLIPGMSFEWQVSRKSVAFLDVLIRANCTSSALSETVSISTEIYQKPLNAYQYIPWRSDHPASVKLAFIKGELLRYVRTSSSRAAFTAIRTLFWERLRARGYPVPVLRSAFATVDYTRDRKGALTDRVRPSASRAPLVFHGTYNPIWRQIDMPVVFEAMASTWSPSLARSLMAPGQSRVIRAMHRARSLGDLVSVSNVKALRDESED
jgi:hypothetical protein